jgi:hypothetical protein
MLYYSAYKQIHFCRLKRVNAIFLSHFSTRHGSCSPAIGLREQILTAPDAIFK